MNRIRKAKVLSNKGQNEHFLEIGSICEIQEDLDDGAMIVFGISDSTGNQIKQVVSKCDIEELDEIEI